ncbi:MAG: DNA-binding protein HU [Oleiphilus sp.]|nr:MAG: DNA-binding protein HU [Oleiphilus sp.]
MKKPELAAAIASKADVSKEKAGEILNIITDEITNAVSQDDAVSLVGFGTFSRRARSARTGKNPQTGAAIQIPASNTVGFKAGKALKDAVN